MPARGIGNQHTVAGWFYNAIGNFRFSFEDAVVEEFLEIGGSVCGFADVADINETAPAGIDHA